MIELQTTHASNKHVPGKRSTVHVTIAFNLFRFFLNQKQKYVLFKKKHISLIIHYISFMYVNDYKNKRMSFMSINFIILLFCD